MRTRLSLALPARRLERGLGLGLGITYVDDALINCRSQSKRDIAPFSGGNYQKLSSCNTKVLHNLMAISW